MRHLLHTGATGLLLLALADPAAAQVSLSVKLPPPPPIVFPAPPSVVVLPDLDIYVAPDLAEDLFFVDGWWWRPWEGRWYRSRHYDKGWAHYPKVPAWYGHVPPGWRDDYRQRRWGKGPWDHHPIPHAELHKNWRKWRAARPGQAKEGQPRPYDRDDWRPGRGRDPREAHPVRDPRTARPGLEPKERVPKDKGPKHIGKGREAHGKPKGPHQP